MIVSLGTAAYFSREGETAANVLRKLGIYSVTTVSGTRAIMGGFCGSAGATVKKGQANYSTILPLG